MLDNFKWLRPIIILIISNYLESLSHVGLVTFLGECRDESYRSNGVRLDELLYSLILCKAKCQETVGCNAVAYDNEDFRCTLYLKDDGVGPYTQGDGQLSTRCYPIAQGNVVGFEKCFLILSFNL